MKPKSVKVSVIMPAYNAAATIDRAIGSVLSQKGAVFELLVADDGSKDDTWQALQKYRQDPRVRLYRFLRNRGVSAARNWLISRARGKYLSFCDADDEFLQGNLRCFAAILDQKPKVGLVYGDWYPLTLKGRRGERKRFFFRNNWDLLGGQFSTSGTLIRRSVMRRARGFSTRLKFLVNCDLCLRLSETTQFYRYRGKPLYCHRRVPGSLSDKPKRVYQRISHQIFRDCVMRRYHYKVPW